MEITSDTVQAWFAQQPPNVIEYFVKQLAAQLPDKQLKSVKNKIVHVIQYRNKDKGRVGNDDLPVDSPAGVCTPYDEYTSVGFDVEKVTGKKRPGVRKHQNLAGHVVVVTTVNGKRHVLLDTYVKRSREEIHNH